MNRYHRRLCRSDAWAEKVRTTILPAALAGVELGTDVLELGPGPGRTTEQLLARAPRLTALELDGGAARALRARLADPRLAVLEGDATAMPFPDGSFDAVVCLTMLHHLPDAAAQDRLLAEAARVLRPGGRFVFSVTHPTRWAFPDDPGPGGLTVAQSYFDRTPYVEVDEHGTATYVEHHRTLGDRVRELVAAGLVLEDLVEPEWPAGHEREWGQWSPLRGRLMPGTAIFVTRRPL
jgi:SAM-dependent methyltransferase